VTGVTIGHGKLAGKGIYAARDFAKGELVVPYNLTELSQAEFDALPMGEREWTHSFWGRIFLFPEPTRYVNNADEPTTFPDLERQGNYALRDIKAGEAITIDDSIELLHELETFVEAYEKAANSRDFDRVAPLVADDATFWFTNGTFEDKAAIRRAFEDTYETIIDEKYSITNVKWVVATYWNAVYTYRFRSEGLVNGQKQIYEGYGTNALKRLDGSWRIVHEHLSSI
jgi:ketosteroid isomerase-like protein